LNTNVVGGFSKLLKYFRKYYFGSIISYADCGRSNGNLYTKNGFTLINQTDPGFYWTKSGKVYHRTVFQKYKLEKNIEASELFSAIPELLKKPLFKGFTSAFGNILS